MKRLILTIFALGIASSAFARDPSEYLLNAFYLKCVSQPAGFGNDWDIWTELKELSAIPELPLQLEHHFTGVGCDKPLLTEIYRLARMRFSYVAIDVNIQSTVETRTSHMGCYDVLTEKVTIKIPATDRSVLEESPFITLSSKRAKEIKRYPCPE